MMTAKDYLKIHKIVTEMFGEDYKIVFSKLMFSKYSICEYKNEHEIPENLKKGLHITELIIPDDLDSNFVIGIPKSNKHVVIFEVNDSEVYYVNC